MNPDNETSAPQPDSRQIRQLLQLHRPALALTLAEQLLARDPTALEPQLTRVEALRQL